MFSTPMMQSILRGTKTQTRRVLKPQPLVHNEVIKMPLGISEYAKIIKQYSNKGYTQIYTDGPLKGMLAPLCPYGQVGDTLWVRETWAKIITPEGKDAFVYRADDEYYKDTISDWQGWKPSIFMPKEACRLVLKITNVRAERLNDISDTDAISEGIAISSRFGNEVNQWIDYIDGNGTPSPVYSFQTLWQSINGEKSWNENPFVWVIEFRKIK